MKLKGWSKKIHSDYIDKTSKAENKIFSSIRAINRLREADNIDIEQIKSKLKTMTDNLDKYRDFAKNIEPNIINEYKKYFKDNNIDVEPKTNANKQQVNDIKNTVIHIPFNVQMYCSCLNGQEEIYYSNNEELVDDKKARKLWGKNAETELINTLGFYDNNTGEVVVLGNNSRSTTPHEIGHSIHLEYIQTFKPEIFKSWSDLYKVYNKEGVDVPRRYFLKNEKEFFACSFQNYVFNGVRFSMNYPELYNKVDKTLKELKIK
jgi:hypothetical protein